MGFLYILGLLLAGAFAFLLFKFLRGFVFVPMDEALKGIPAIPPLVSLSGILLSPIPSIDTQIKVMQEYGYMYLVNGFVPGKWMVWVCDPTAAKKINTDTKTFEKLDDASLRTRFVEMWLGTNIVVANGPDWQRLHRIFKPAFHWECLKSFVPHFGRSAVQAVTWCIKEHNAKHTKNEKLRKLMSEQGFDEEDGVIIDVVPLMQRLTMDVLGQSIFSFDFGTLSAEETPFTSLYNRIVSAVFSPIRIMFPFANADWFPGSKAVADDIDSFSNNLLDVINQRRSLKDYEPSNRDLLDCVIASDLTNEELKHNLNIFFLAGHDTTSTSLSMALNLLALHPEIQEKARIEVMEVLDGDEYPSFEKQKKLTYISQVIKETLRMYPPVGNLPPRITSQECEVMGRTFPAGTLFSVGIYQLHHNPDLWEDPETFDPSRWDPSKKQPANAWMPFGLGQRACLGLNFSLQEQKIFLAVLLSQFRIELGPTTKSRQQQLTGRNFDLGPLLFMQPSDLYLRLVPL